MHRGEHGLEVRHAGYARWKNGAMPLGLPKKASVRSQVNDLPARAATDGA